MSSSPSVMLQALIAKIRGVAKAHPILAGLLAITLTSQFYRRFLKPRKSVAGKIVLITGGGSGIGALMARRLGQLGATVVLWDINMQGMAAVQADLQQRKCPKCHIYQCDISNPDKVNEVAAQVQAQVGKVDILINNAGMVVGKYITDLTPKQIQRTFAVNCLAHFYTIKAFLPAMMEDTKTEANIVTICSASGVGGAVKLCDYSSSKFAVFGLDESLRMELAHRGVKHVKTTVVCPYFINTGLFDGVAELRGIHGKVLPILKPDYVAKKTVDALRTNTETLMLPRMIYTGPFMRFFFPVWLFDAIYFHLKINASMDTFTGRVKK